jgi:hypothetical protein
MRDSRAASIKGWETRKRRAQALDACPELYGPNGTKRGTQRHKVKSISDILARFRANSDQTSGDSPPTPERRTNDAGIHGEAPFAVGARKPETTG